MSLPEMGEQEGGVIVFFCAHVMTASVGSVARA